MGQRLQPAERQKPTRALDRVNGPEDAGDQIPRSRFLLESDEIPVDLIQVLVALHQEFADDLAKVFHGLPPARFPMLLIDRPGSHLRTPGLLPPPAPVGSGVTTRPPVAVTEAAYGFDRGLVGIRPAEL